VLRPRQRFKLARGAQDKEHAMSQKLNSAMAVIGIDIGKNSFHIVAHDQRGAIVLRQKWSRGQVEPLVRRGRVRDQLLHSARQVHKFRGRPATTRWFRVQRHRLGVAFPTVSREN
jgi:hypothetical protein